MNGASVAVEVQELSVRFRTAHGVVHALSDATLEIAAGELLVVVGESGSGKSVLAQAILGLLPRNAEIDGSVFLAGRQLIGLPAAQLRAERAKRLAYVPQSPSTALNPVRRVGPVLLELARGRGLARERAWARLAETFDMLDLDLGAIGRAYPHELSGGMQQRVLIALALVGEPTLVVADEPTSALDADLVAATAEQIAALARRGAAVLVVTHDLKLAAQLGGRVALVYASRIVELRDSGAFFAGPAHPYGRGLLAARPACGGVPIAGVAPELTRLPPACGFAPRCEDREPVCTERVPELLALPDDSGAVRCPIHAAG